MAKPTTKQELLNVSNKQFERLMSLIESIPSDRLNDTFDYDISKEKGAHWQRDRNIRDVLIHVHEWHNLMIKYVNDNEKKEEVLILPPFFM